MSDGVHDRLNFIERFRPIGVGWNPVFAFDALPASVCLYANSAAIISSGFTKVATDRKPEMGKPGGGDPMLQSFNFRLKGRAIQRHLPKLNHDIGPIRLEVVDVVASIPRREPHQRI